MGDRIPLSSLRALTLYAGRYTAARRTAPVPQLECTGYICRDYQPSAVQCTNTGGSSTDIDWKCEADLPSSLRFGKLQVSCEGWDRPGDPYVLRGSCGLTYSLVRAPQYGESTTSYTTYILYIVGLLVAIYLVIAWLFPSSPNRSTPNARNTPGSGGGGWGSGQGWRGRGGGPSSLNDAPPPYSKHTSSQNPNQPWSPGFWTGLGAGGLAAGIYNYLTRPRPAATTVWDWERPGSRTGAYQPEPSAGRRRTTNVPWDNGDGGSNSRSAGSSTGPGTRLGELRRATGYAGTSVR